MASDSDSSSSPLPSWQFMVLVAAALGAFLTSGKLGSLSPSAIEPQVDKGSLVDAHLSDDPFGAWVRAAKKSDSGEGTPPGVSGAGLPAPIGASGSFGSLVRGQRVCLLPVVVRGDFHSAEAREMRIRFRAATVSGLGAQGLISDDPDHLLLIAPPAAWSREPGRKPPGIDQPFPAEWFVPSGLPKQDPSPYGAVLVVWVQDETLFRNPLKALEDLKGELKAQVLGLHGIEADRIDFKVIGPYWSGTLTDMMAERKAARDAGIPNLGADTIFYSPTATMADGVLDLFADADTNRLDVQAGLGRDGQPIGRKRFLHPENGPQLVSLTCTDEDIADALLNELLLRGVKINDSTRIAIVSDWDTEYGRVLPLTFAAKLRQLRDRIRDDPTYNPSTSPALGRLTAESYAKLKFDEDRHWPRQVLKAFYISGVGGTASSGSASPADDSGKSSGDSADPQPLERAEGEHQVDYLARLATVFANRLEERDHPEAQEKKPGRPEAKDHRNWREKIDSKSETPVLRAIGLLGSNVNDELLLLQVLRPRFPNAIFFTDKLDARFLDRGLMKYTRNLVVASSYGFELFQRLQVGVNPFRSSEQTGAFLAVQAAVGMRVPALGTLTEQLQPLRFEIGRTYPVPLFVANRREPKLAAQNRFNDHLHPTFDIPLASFWTKHASEVVCMLLGAGFFGAMTVFIFLGRFKLEPAERPDVLAGAVILGACVALVALFTIEYDGFEPLIWIEGVSIWPSEFVRLLALMTAVGSLYYCASRVKRNRTALCREFGLVERDPILPAKPGLFPAIKEVLSRMPLSQDDYLLTEEEDRAAVLYLMDPASDYRGAVAAAMAVRQVPGGATEKSVRYLSAQVLWRYLCERSMPIRRYARAGLMTAGYIMGWIFLFYIIDIPTSPTRGSLSEIWDGAILISTSILMVYLIFWVVDETQSCYRFVSRLGEDSQSLWPEEAFNKIPSFSRAAGAQASAERKAASAYIEVQFIGRLTAEAVPLIILPFVVLTLMILARWTFFANWHMSPSILAFCGEDAAICALCALLLKNAATKAKLRAVRNIGLSAADARAAGAGDFADALAALQSDMEDNHEGAFLPWHQQPFVKAILLPFGGSGIMQAIEFITSKQ